MAGPRGRFGLAARPVVEPGVVSASGVAWKEMLEEICVLELISTRKYAATTHLVQVSKFNNFFCFKQLEVFVL